MNSIKLNSWAKNSFDLIWVDGAHGYPVLPLDLYNACRLIKKNGHVVVDDVFTNLRKTDEMYRSTAAIQTLQLFHETNLRTITILIENAYNFVKLYFLG